MPPLLIWVLYPKQTLHCYIRGTQDLINVSSVLIKVPVALVVHFVSLRALAREFL